MCRVLDLYIYLFLTGGIYIYELTKCKVVSLSCVLRVYKPSIVHSDCLFSDSTAPPLRYAPFGAPSHRTL